MSGDLTMPKLSDSMADAVILKWLKSPGDEFRRGDALMEVETDKATVVYEAEADGRLAAILVPEGGTAAVGQAIAELGAGNGARAAAGRPNATPVARKKALELGISLHGIEGTGPGGRITQEDVERTGAAAPAAQPSTGDARGSATVAELTPTQATIARRMVESATTIPAFTVSTAVDMSLVIALRKDVPDAPSVNDFVVKAAATALRDFPRFNASYVDGAVHSWSRVNVGVAVATEDALLVPVVLDADEKPLAQISAETRRLAEAARRRSLRPEDLQGATFTVSNLGMFGITSFTAIVDAPQVAILAVGTQTLTVSCDHRVLYGADGARFLSRLGELLERPLELLR